MASEWDGTAWAGTPASGDAQVRHTRGELPPTPMLVGGQHYPLLVPYVDGVSTLGLSAVFRCVTLIADAVSGLPWTEQRGPEDAPVPIDPSRLIRRPMLSMTRREWTWRVVATLALHNTAYLLHVGGTDSEGVPWSLLPVPPQAISPADAQQDPWGLLPPTRYMVGDLFVRDDQLTIIRRAPFPGVPDHLASVLKLARRSFGAALAAETHHARYWQRGGPVLDVLTTEQELTDPEAEGLAQRWANRRSLGSDYPAVLGKGARAEPYGADPTTDSAVMSRREIVADVGRYFGVPTRLLNAPRTGDTETYANVEDDAVDLDRFTLAGYYGPVQDGISELLPGDYVTGRRMRMDTTRLTQGSIEARSRAYPPLVGAGILSQEEARRIGFGLPPRTDPDAAQAPANMEASPDGIAEAV